jgi:hypothetical protein
MRFLFHTLVDFDGKEVYYNIHSFNETCFWAGILDNPNDVKEAIDFVLDFIDGEWTCSVKLPDRAIEILGEEILEYLRCHT